MLAQSSRVQLPPPPPGWEVLRYALLAEGGFARLLGNADAPARARIWISDGLVSAEGPAFPRVERFPVFDRFPDGRWLVASARAEREEENGRILSPDGRELGRLRLGDGIWHLKIDREGRIWVGWFDEGVFGNDGWRVPGLEWPPSAYGLAAFDDTGRVLFHADAAPGLDGIADCYALNVVEGTAWACSYTGFPILECRPEAACRWWASGLSGPSAIAVSFPYVLAAGDYSEESDRLVLLRLEVKEGRKVAEWRLPNGLRGQNAAQFADARGDRLHLVAEGCWHRWRVADFLDGLEI